MARCRWFEEDSGSEVVFWFDVAHVHHHSLLPVPIRSVALKSSMSVFSMV